MLAELNLDGVREIALSWAVVALVGGVAMGVLRLTVPSVRGGVFPPQRLRLAPWRLVDLALAVLIFVGLDYLMATLFGLRESERIYSTTLRGNTQGSVAAGLPGGGIEAVAQYLASLAAYRLDQAEQAFRQLCATSVGRPIQALAIIGVMVFVAGGRLYQLGLTFHHLARVLFASYLVWLVITPLVFLVYWLVLQLELPQEHPVKTLIQMGASWPAWGLILFAVLIAAPLLEELLFRGILQPIMVRSPEVADLSLLLSLIGIILYGSSQVLEHGFLNNPWPIILLVGTGSGYLGFERLMWRWLPQPGPARAIFATSVLFAALHHAVWPTPIPLFFLSLGLGYLGYRTQSLIGPIVVHSLFNLVTVGELLQG